MRRILLFTFLALSPVLSGAPTLLEPPNDCINGYQEIQPGAVAIAPNHREQGALIRARVERLWQRPIPKETAVRLRARWAGIDAALPPLMDKIKSGFLKRENPDGWAWKFIDNERMEPSLTISRNRVPSAHDDWLKAEQVARDWANSERPLTVEWINSINLKVNSGLPLDSGTPGLPRHHDLRMQASPRFVHPHAEDVEPMLQEFVEWYARESKNPAKHPVALAAEAYQRLVTIKPYADGNGRTARLVMDAILLRRGYPPPIFSGEKSQIGGVTVSDSDASYFGLLDDNENLPPEFILESVTAGIQRTVQELHRMR